MILLNLVPDVESELYVIRQLEELERSVPLL